MITGSDPRYAKAAENDENVATGSFGAGEVSDAKCFSTFSAVVNEVNVAMGSFGAGDVIDARLPPSPNVSAAGLKMDRLIIISVELALDLLGSPGDHKLPSFRPNKKGEAGPAPSSSDASSTVTASQNAALSSELPSLFPPLPVTDDGTSRDILAERGDSGTELKAGPRPGGRMSGGSDKLSSAGRRWILLD